MFYSIGSTREGWDLESREIFCVIGSREEKKIAAVIFYSSMAFKLWS